jgi:hypothetical protein
LIAALLAILPEVVPLGKTRSLLSIATLPTTTALPTLALLLAGGALLIALSLAAGALTLPLLLATLATLTLPLALLLLATLAALPLALLLLAAARQPLQTIPHLLELCQRLLVVVPAGGVPAQRALRFPQLIAKVVQAFRDGCLPRKHVGSVATPE